MSKVTLVLDKQKYTVDEELLVKHSQFFEDLLDTYPGKEEIKLPFPIKSLDKFVDYMNGKTISFDYDEFIVHQYLNTKSYFDHLIDLMIQERPDRKKIDSLDKDLSWEIYNRLSGVTLVLNDEKYVLDGRLLNNHSEFLKDIFDMYPGKEEFKLPFPIKSLHKFIDYVKGTTGDNSVDYDEFRVHEYLDTKSYFDHLIYLMVKEGPPDHQKIRSLGRHLSFEIYDNLPLNMIPEEMLTDKFIERYRRKRLPKYPENVRVTRNGREVKTEVLISGKYYMDGPYRSWYPNGLMKERSNWSKGKMIHGLLKSWYEDGEMKQGSEGKGQIGLYQTWYENGELSVW